MDNNNNNDPENAHHGEKCVEKIRVADFRQVEKGDQIVIPGDLTSFNRMNKHFYLYSHHAIVESVALIKENPSRACIRCFHYNSTPFDTTIKIRETNTVYDLLLDEVYVYKGDSNKQESVIKRAKEQKEKQKKYNIVTSNCEDYANFCTIDMPFGSNQVRNAISKCANVANLCIFVLFCCCGQLDICASVMLLLVCIACMEIHKFYQNSHAVFKDEKTKHSYISAVKSGDIVRLPQLYHDCIVCDVHWDTAISKWKVIAIHYKFPVGIIPKGKIVQEEFIVSHNQKIIIKDFSKYRCFCPEETIDRANKRLFEERFNPVKNSSSHLCFWAKVRPTLPRHKKVSVEMNVTGEFDGNRKCNSPLLIKNNRRGRPFSTLKMPPIDVWTVEDISAGDVITFKGMVGIVLQDTRSFDTTKECKIPVVTLNCTKQVIKSVWTVNLNTDNVKRQMFHPSHMHSKEDIVKNAKTMKGMKFKDDTQFIKECVCNRKELSRIRQFGDFKEGEVISFRRFHFNLKLHDAVVIKNHEYTPSNGRVTLIHYDRKEICQTDLDVDFEKEEFYIKTFEGYETYPLQLSVDRAGSRLGEKKYNWIGRRSSHFCHWVRVIQSPCFAVTNDISNKVSNDEYVEGHAHKAEQEVLLVPDLGNACRKGYQKVEIFAMNELNVGSVISFKYERYSKIIKKRTGYGIVSDVSATGTAFKVIHLKKSFASKGTVVEEWIPINIKRDRLWLYRWHPQRCFSPKEIVENARSKLGMKARRFQFGSLNFWFDRILVNTQDNEVDNSDPISF